MFTIQGLEGSQDKLLGIWQPDSAPVLSFSAPNAPLNKNAEAVVWSVAMPSSPMMAQRLIDQQARALSQTEQAIGLAGQKLQGLSADWLEVSFAVGQIDTPADATLRHNLMRGQERQTEISFGLSDDVAQSWDSFQKFIQQTFQLLSPTLYLETKIEQNLLAYSTVQFNGNIETTWPHSATILQTWLHKQSLALALKSRVATLQFLGQIVAGGAALAMKFNLEGPLALPAAWRYIQDVLAMSKSAD